MSPAHPLSGQVAAVTGAASGIGLAIGKVLHEQGAAVVALDINPDVVAAFQGPDQLGLVVDLTNQEAVKNAIVETVRLISVADGGVGQLLQIHNVMLRGIFSGYPDEVRDQLIGDVLAGKRFGNALAEVGGKNKFALKTRVERRADGTLVLNGSKFYSTGSYLAEWISLTAASDDGGAGVLLHRLLERTRGAITLTGMDRDDFDADHLALTGSGRIARPAGLATFTAALDFAATGLRPAEEAQCQRGGCSQHCRRDRGAWRAAFGRTRAETGRSLRP